MEKLDDKKLELIKRLEQEDNDKFILKRIKGCRQPDLKEGDIFALQPQEGLYYFGRIVKAGNKNAQIGGVDSAAVIFIFDYSTSNLKDYLTEFDYSKVLIGPLIVEAGYWTRGWFYKVGNIPLTVEEKKLDYCFYRFGHSEKQYVDEYGIRVDKKSSTPFISRFGIETSIGVLFTMKKAWIIKGEYGLTGVSEMES